VKHSKTSFDSENKIRALNVKNQTPNAKHNKLACFETQAVVL
jgi:hypothetical protein